MPTSANDAVTCNDADDRTAKPFTRVQFRRSLDDRRAVAGPDRRSAVADPARSRRDQYRTGRTGLDDGRAAQMSSIKPSLSRSAYSSRSA